MEGIKQPFQFENTLLLPQEKQQFKYLEKTKKLLLYRR